MKKTVKNKFVLVILAIAIFIPSVVAVVNYNREKNGPVDTKSVVSMKVGDLDGVEYSFSKDTEEGRRTIDIFVAMMTDAEEVGQLPEPLFDDPFYLVTMSNGNTEAIYRYYFDSASADAYYTDSNGSAFKPAASAVEAFMKSSLSASIYGDSKLPVLALTGGDGNVKPSDASWFYRDFSGEFVVLDCSDKISTESEVYSVEGGLSMNFEPYPDYFHVTVVNASDNNVIFDDLYENISQLKFDKASKVKVDVEAKWYEDSEREFYGEMEYSFGADISAPAVFYLGAGEISNGECVSVTGINITDPSKVKFSSEPDIGYTPVFYKDGDVVCALIPISADKRPVSAAAPDTYKFTFTYGGTVQETELRVNLRDYHEATEYTYTVADNIAALYSDASRSAASNALSSVFASGSSERYFGDGDFAKLFDDHALNRSFGKNYKLNGGSAFKQLGLEYTAPDGEDVKAAEAGEVVYVGTTDVTGNIVIIEHGYGLKTLYCHLGSASVAVGDKVAKGGVVGKCGRTGFTNTSGVYFGMYVGTVPVSVYPFWNDGTFGRIPFYAGN